MNLAEVSATTGLALSLCALLAVLGGWLRWIRPRWRNGRREITAVRDAILGREAQFDSITGKEISPALPGMGVRMAHQEQQMELITSAVARLAETHERLENHESRIKKLEDAAVERVVARAESAAAWRAMEAAHLAEAPLTLDDEQDG